MLFLKYGSLFSFLVVVFFTLTSTFTTQADSVYTVALPLIQDTRGVPLSHQALISVERTKGSSIYDAYLVRGDGQIIRRVNDAALTLKRVLWSPDKEEILLSYQNESLLDFYRVRTDGSDLQFVGTGSSISENYTQWSPDSQKVLLVRPESNDENSPVSFYVHSRTQGTQLVYTANSLTSTEWSPDSRNLLLTINYPSTSVYVLDAQGINPPVELVTSQNPVVIKWSPDGALLAYYYQPEFDGRTELYLYSASLRQTQFVSYNVHSSVLWTEQGTTLTFTTGETIENEPHYQLWSITATGTLRQMRDFGDKIPQPLGWVDDDTRLLIGLEWSMEGSIPHSQFAIIDFADTRDTYSTPLPAPVGFTRISPDTHSIVFATSSQVDSALYTLNTSTASPKEVHRVSNPYPHGNKEYDPSSIVWVNLSKVSFQLKSPYDYSDFRYALYMFDPTSLEPIPRLLLEDFYEPHLLPNSFYIEILTPPDARHVIVDILLENTVPFQIEGDEDQPFTVIDWR